MRTAIIDKSGLVDNVADVGSGDWSPPANHTAVASDVAEIGWTYKNGQFTAPVVVPVPPVVPDEVTRRQFKLQLEISGLATVVAGWVASKPKLVQISFNESGSFKRSEPMMQDGFQALGYTTSQIDAFFTAASLL